MEMERLNLVKNGLLRLPPGFRFHPTDEELVVQYLKRKVLACPLPASIIQEFDVCKSDPCNLPGDSEQERYFFSTKEVKYPNGSRSNRATGSGYWKATGLDKQIVSPKNHDQVVGMKKTLVFYRGKPPKGRRTDWIMHEYRLVNSSLHKISNHENWVLCRIFLKKRTGKSGEDEAPIPSSQNGPVFYDFMAKERANSSSGSSGITEISKQNVNADDHEDSSSGNSFSISCRSKQCP